MSLANKKIFLYKSSDGSIKVDVFIEGENIRLSQKKMGEIFGVDSDTI